MSTAVLSIGSNLGDRLAQLASVLMALQPKEITVSPVYETAPWGPVPQDDFFNAVVLTSDPGRTAADWLEFAHRCERAAHRTRTQRWGPRSLDVDVISVRDDDGRDVVSDDPDLTLPHPRAHERAFVLVPWVAADAAAELYVVDRRIAVAQLVAQLPPTEVAGVRATGLRLDR